MEDERLLSDFMDKVALFSKDQGKEFSSSLILDSTFQGLINYIPVGIQDNLKNLGDTVLLTGKGLGGAVLETGRGLGAVLETGKGLGGAVLEKGKGFGFGILDYASSKDSIFSSWNVSSKAKQAGRDTQDMFLGSGSRLTSTLLDTMGSIYRNGNPRKSYSDRNTEVHGTSGTSMLKNPRIYYLR